MRIRFVVDGALSEYEWGLQHKDDDNDNNNTSSSKQQQGVVQLEPCQEALLHTLILLLRQYQVFNKPQITASSYCERR